MTRDEMRVAFAAAAYQAVLSSKLANATHYGQSILKESAHEAWNAAEAMLEVCPVAPDPPSMPPGGPDA